ncbi:MAG: type I restriction endonuclease subunit R [Candidatus Eremiobacteraeota bacterium]|nr:type I restriction endonuclease subunit R [Candidatus Eremiobacteraeota bacterium]
MARYLNEDDIELYAIEMLAGLGYAYLPGAEIAPDGSHEERKSFKDAILVKRLRAAIARLNPNLPPSAREDALRKVIVHETTDLVLNNKRFHRFLIEGVDVEYSDGSGSVRYAKARIIDFADPEANDWLAVNQYTIKEEAGERRPDLLVFINGLPIALFEFKNPTDPKATILSAFNQLQTYKHDLPGLLAYNELLVVADGTHARMGALTADWERFSAWKREDGAAVPVEIEPLVNEVFEKRRLLDILRSFVLFETTTPANKILAAYHQYYGVNKALERTIAATAAGGDRRIGVFWHTQGSGKSLSMTFYASKIAQQPELENPTLVVLTDPNDLDDQLFGQFMRCAELLRQTPEQAESREVLRTALAVASGHIIFTTIQKFLPETAGERYPAVTQRRNVIVIADEAHRSQYGFGAHMDEGSGKLTYGFARHLHDALPNASFIGFTGTPVELTDHNTRTVFGNYIDVYDVRRAVEDGSTVPIYYEARVVRVDLDAKKVSYLDEEFEDITEGQEEDEKRRAASRWSQLEALVGAEARIEEIAGDIVEHFERRQKGFDFEGKAMIVCMSRRICARIYQAIVARRPAWHDDADERGVLKVVMTGSASDEPALQPHIRNKSRRRAIEKRFKDPADSLKLVIVRDMWLTGFDVPALHTMYVDKPMKGHSLVQAIARVNRVFKTKAGGLVVDYFGIMADLKSALATYADSGGKGEPVLNEEDAVAVLQRDYEVVRGMFHGFPYQAYLEGNTAAKMLGLNKGADHILGLEDGKSRFLRACESLAKGFSLASTSAYARGIADEVAFFRGVRATIVKVSGGAGQSLEEIDLALQQLVSEAVGARGIVDVLAQSGIARPDISVFSDEFLDELAGVEQRNLAREMLERLLRDEIKVRSRRNAVQARKFSDMLVEAIARYENRSLTTVQLIEHLIEFAKELRDEPKRAEAMGLSEDELAFYDALAQSKSAVEVLGDETLRTIARELLKSIRENATIDWNLREGVRAAVRLRIKKLLRKYKYPPDATENATDQVLEQAELLCKDAA